MRSPCDTCAFGKSGAALEPHNQLKGLICALGPFPFACHHTRDGWKYDWRSGDLAFIRLPKSQRVMCAGWRREVAKRAKAGYFRGPYRVIRKAVAHAALDMLAVFLHPESPEEKAEAKSRLDRMLRFLCRRDIGPLKIPLGSPLAPRPRPQKAE